jgi:hypothetical protein
MVPNRMVAPLVETRVVSGIDQLLGRVILGWFRCCWHLSFRIHCVQTLLLQAGIHSRCQEWIIVFSGDCAAAILPSVPRGPNLRYKDAVKPAILFDACWFAFQSFSFHVGYADLVLHRLLRVGVLRSCWVAVGETCYLPTRAIFIFVFWVGYAFDEVLPFLHVLAWACEC